MYYGHYQTAQTRDALERERLMLWTETSQDIEGDDPFLFTVHPAHVASWFARMLGMKSGV